MVWQRMVRHLLTVALSGFCLQGFAQKGLILSNAQVAPDAQKFSFSATAGTAFSIYEQPLGTEGRAEKISVDAPAFHCFAPAYSADGKYLLYLKEPTATSKKSNYADVMLYDRQLHTTTALTAGQQNITQALFSPDGKRIVYIAAGFFGSYSPVGPKAAHELDVYSMALDGTAPIQHSHIKAYALGNIALLQAPGTYLLNIFDPRQKLSGTYAYSLTDSTRFQLVKDQVAAAHGLSHLPNLTTSPQKTLVYSIGVELFVKNMRNGASTLVYTGAADSNPHPMAFVGGQNKVLFSETLAGNPMDKFGAFRINILNLDDLKVISVPIKLD